MLHNCSVRNKIWVEKYFTDMHDCSVRNRISVRYCVPDGTPKIVGASVFYQYPIPNGIKQERICFCMISTFFTNFRSYYVVNALRAIEYIRRHPYSIDMNALTGKFSQTVLLSVRTIISIEECKRYRTRYCPLGHS